MKNGSGSSKRHQGGEPGLPSTGDGRICFLAGRRPCLKAQGVFQNGGRKIWIMANNPRSVSMLVALLLVIVLQLCPFCPEAHGFEMSGSGGNATEITASSMSYSHQKTTVVFSGDVQVVRSNFRLWCRTLTVHLRSEAASSLNAEGPESAASGQDRELSQQFKKIVAEGDVRLEMDDREATGDRAVYEAASETLTLLGDVVLSQGQNRIQGQKVTFYLRENKTEIAGGDKDQVKALFFPSDEGESGNASAPSLQSE
jgi:lipopolysaccharide export system protein LptA